MSIILRHFRNDYKENKKYNLIIFKKLMILLIILNKKNQLTKNNKINLNKKLLIKFIKLN